MITRCTALIAAAAFATASAEPSRVCTPGVMAPITVDGQVRCDAAALRVQPKLSDIFAWPDTPMGVIRTAGGLRFFASNGGNHRQLTFRLA